MLSNPICEHCGDTYLDHGWDNKIIQYQGACTDYWANFTRIIQRDQYYVGELPKRIKTRFEKIK